MNSFITHAAFLLAASQLLFLFNLVYSLRRGKPSPSNPWQATTLEWQTIYAPSDATAASKQYLVVYRSPCHYFGSNGESFLAQWSPEPLSPSTLDTNPE